MKVISLLNQKGGVGKTTSTYNLSTALALKGYKTLMIDSDSQASLTLMTANDPLKIKNNLPALYLGTTKIKKCIYKTTIDNLFILPSSINLSKAEKLAMNEIGRENKIKKALNEIKNDFDYVLIDCPPALSLLTINNLVASDYIIAPCEPNDLSIYALEDLKETIEEIKEKVNYDLKFMGIIVTKYDQRIKIQKEKLRELENNETIIGIVKSAAAAVKGMEEGKPVVLNDPKSVVSIAYKEICNYIEEECNHG